jgi:hypothetical protein
MAFGSNTGYDTRHRWSLRVYADHIALRPPSRLRTQLFAYWFEARKTAASAISSGVPNRFSGIWEIMCSRAGDENPRVGYVSMSLQVLLDQVELKPRSFNELTPQHRCVNVPWHNDIHPKNLLELRHLSDQGSCETQDARLRRCVDGCPPAAFDSQ